MKKFLLAAVTATLVASPILAAAPAEAQQRRVEQTVRHKANGTTVVKRTTTVRPTYRNSWRKGERFDRRQARNYREISDWRAYRNHRLYAPPRGYHWVRAGNDAVLVAQSNGVIRTVIGGTFR